LIRLAAVVEAATTHPLVLPILMVLAVACLVPAVWAGLYGDDYVILGILSGTSLREVYPSRLDVFNFFGGRPERTHRMLDLGLLPWWMPPEVQVAFWRPVSALTHWIDYTLWRERPALMHLQNLGWLGALILAALLTYRGLMGAGAAAGMAALLYAFGRPHVLPATDIVGRNTLIGACFGVLTVLLHDRWRRCGWSRGTIAAPASFALALLSAENAITSAAYIVAHSIYVDRSAWPNRLRALLPYGLIATGWYAFYRSRGYGVREATPYFIDPLRQPLEFALAIARNGPVLLSSAWLGPPVGNAFGPSPPAGMIRWLAAVLTLALLVVLLRPLLKRSATARFWALGQTLAVVPLCTALPHDRYLSIVVLGTMGLLAQRLGEALSRLDQDRAPRLGQGLVGLSLGLLVVANLVVAPLRAVAVAVDRARMEPAHDTIPVEASMRGQSLVIVNAPQALSTLLWFFVRAARDQPIPAHTRMLASGPAPLRLDRPDARTIRVRWEGPQEPIFRPRDRPLVVGHRVALTGTDVEVTAVSADGWPAEAVFRFDRSLEDPGLRWVRWERGQGRFVPFDPPAVGGATLIH
jgi:hypothetical protein